MATRAVFTFIDNKNHYHIYKFDAEDPNGAAEFIKAAIQLAWALPRFEATDFAAAFIGVSA